MRLRARPARAPRPRRPRPRRLEPWRLFCWAARSVQRCATDLILASSPEQRTRSSASTPIAWVPAGTSGVRHANQDYESPE